MGIERKAPISPMQFDFPPRLPLPLPRPGGVIENEREQCPSRVVPTWSCMDARWARGGRSRRSLATRIIKTLAAIVKDKTATKRERTSAARALMQASRVELDAIRLAQGVQCEDLTRRVMVLEEHNDGRLAEAASND